MENVLGIIAEYNPFHNGHLYHFQEAKKKANAKYTITIMSGNFTQRGDTSIINKWDKAELALRNGVDLVIELPTIYSISSAENFARGAIKILNSLNIVNNIAFGVEDNDIEKINKIVDILVEEQNDFKEILKEELDKGNSFPVARENAIVNFLNINKDSKEYEKFKQILSNPNNILAIEYLKELKKEASKIKPILIKRNIVDYNNKEINNKFASATGIRNLLKEKIDIKDKLEKLEKVVPKSTYNLMKEKIENNELVLGIESFEKEILYVLRRMKKEEINKIADVSNGMESTIKNASNNSNNLEEIIELVKSKRYTLTRIRRIFLYILLGINKEMMEKSKKILPYIRVLGFNENGKELLSKIKKENPDIQIIVSVNKFLKKLENNKTIDKEYKNNLFEMIDLDILATNIYNLSCKNNIKANMDYTNKIIKI